MRNKRGQITLFIIFVIIIVVITFLIIFLMKKEKISKIELPVFIRAYLRELVRSESKTSLIAIGLHGGRIPPIHQFETEHGIISYWFLDGELLIPKIEETEKDLSLSIEKNLRSKVDFSNLSFDNWEILIDTITVNSKIDKDEVRIFVNFSLTIKKESQVVKLKEQYIDKYRVSIPKMYNAGEKIIKNFKEGTLEPADIEELKVIILDYEDTTVFVLTDPANELNYTLLFAIK